MPRYILNGKVVKINGKFVEYNNSVLSFQVSGDKFPMASIFTSGSNFDATSFYFLSSESNTAIIDYGDGSVISYLFKNNVLEFRPSVPLGDATKNPVYTYTDGKTDIRTIRISFLKPNKITALGTVFTHVFGVFPNEISNLSSLSTISLKSSKLTSFPPSVAGLVSLRTLNLANVGTAITERIPDEFLNIPLETFSIRNSTNISDADTSNFKRLCTVSAMLNTLKFLDIGFGKATLIPEIANFTVLEDFRCYGSSAIIYPQHILNMLSLKVLLGGFSMLDYGGSFPVGSKLESMSVEGSSDFSTQIPISFINLVKLKALLYSNCFLTVIRIDTFINNFYNFIDTNSAKSGVATLPFRGITLNITGIAPTGTFQQPINYVAGSNNGNPASPKEMLWLLTNQYAHTIIYTQ